MFNLMKRRYEMNARLSRIIMPAAREISGTSDLRNPTGVPALFNTTAGRAA
jgi:hypothetical protein